MQNVQGNEYYLSPDCYNSMYTDVPTMPLNPRVVDLMSFSGTLQWGSPSDDGGSSLPLNYTVIYNTASSSGITSTSHLLTNLQHSTQYSWSVQAMNEYGTGPPAVDTFRTPDSGEYPAYCTLVCVCQEGMTVMRCSHLLLQSPSFTMSVLRF